MNEHTRKSQAIARKMGLAGAGLNLFSDEDLEQIHLGTLEVLYDVGVYVPDAEARETFHGGGAKIDEKNKLVHKHPKLIDRRPRQVWKDSGTKSFYDKACEEARNILANHKPAPVDEEAKKKIRDIINGAEEELGLPLSEAPEEL